jgi:L-iditol 2-dehydrogenase/galactitol-1-phosphate 5-dehydrogenase
MKALVLINNGILEYADVPMPEKVTPGDVLIKLETAGICGSDIARAFDNKAYAYPLIMGHELAGVVEDAGRSRFQPGDKVTVFPLLPCHNCQCCHAGEFAHCTSYDYFGSRRHGGFADYLYVPEANLIPLPDGVDMIHAAMTEPCAVALHGVNQLKHTSGTAAVYGSGLIGCMTAYWLQHKGADRVYLVGRSNDKLNIAAAIGAIPVDAKQYDPVDYIRQVTGGGADCVVEAWGFPETFRQALMTARHLGEVSFLGNIKGDFILSESEFSSILRRELTIHGVWNSKIAPQEKDEWSEVLHHMAHGLDLSPLISHTPTLREGADILHMMHERYEYYHKIVFCLNDSTRN